ncbi:MAG: PH domain-containing protein [Raoultibacter sp.]
MSEEVHDQPASAAASDVLLSDEALSRQSEAAPAAALEKHQVNHSYIWLGVMQLVVPFAMVIFFSLIASFSRINGKPGGVEGGFSFVGPIVAVGSIVAVFICLVIYQIVSYKHLYYELGLQEFNLYSGILNKKRVHVPYQRVQSVNEQAGILQRLVGVCTVHIDTAGGASNKAIVVPYLRNTDAEMLRHELYARKQTILGQENIAAQASCGVAAGASNILDAPAEILGDVRGIFGGDQVNTGQVTYEYGLTNKELFLAGASNNTAFAIIVISLVAGVAQLAGQIAPLLLGVAQPIVGRVVESGASLFGGNLFAAAAALTAVILLVLWLGSIIGSCISYGGFHACRRDRRIEVEQGLLQRRFHGVDIDRVQSVIIKQGFIRRCFGYCELSLGKIDSTSEDSSEAKESATHNHGLIVHPFVKLTRVPAILEGLVPEYADVPTENIPVAPVALRRALIRRCTWQGFGMWLIAFVVIAQIALNMGTGIADTTVFVDTNTTGVSVSAGTPSQGEIAPAGVPTTVAWHSVLNGACFVLYAVGVLFIIIDALGAVLWFRGSGFAYNERFMQVTNGGLSRESISFLRKKIQFATARTNPFQRAAKVMTIEARTAAGVGGTTMSLMDVCDEDAQTWLDWVRPRKNVIE